MGSRDHALQPLRNVQSVEQRNDQRSFSAEAGEKRNRVGQGIALYTNEDDVRRAAIILAALRVNWQNGACSGLLFKKRQTGRANGTGLIAAGNERDRLAAACEGRCDCAAYAACAKNQIIHYL